MGFLSGIFGKKKRLLEPADYGLIGTDIHSHLIPGIDDGSKDMEDTLNMLRGFIDLGFKKVITTPHVMSDFYKNNPEIILGGLEKVREAIKKEGLEIEIDAAAEYNVDSELEGIIDRGEILTFGDNHVLFELPFSAEPSNLKQVIFKFQTNGYKLVLAHVERYNFWHGQWDKIEEMLDRNIILQLNINSLSGHYGPGVKRMGEELIERGLIGMISSDCHHIGHLQLMKDTARRPALHQVLENKELLNYKL